MFYVLCAQGQLFELCSFSTTSDANGCVRCERTNVVSSKVNPTPYALRLVIGSENLKFHVVQRWTRDRHDGKHPMINETTIASPAMLKGRVTVEGMQWCEALPAPGRGVRIHSSMSFTV